MNCPGCGRLIPDEKSRRRTRAPDRLTPPQIAQLQSWCIDRQPWALKRLPELIEACLDYWRGKGGQQELHADWVAAVRTWIRKTKAFGADQAERSYPSRPRPEIQVPEVLREPKATPEERQRGAEMLENLVRQKGIR